MQPLKPTMIPSSSLHFGVPGPQQLFRYGETCSWFKHAFEPGMELSRLTWTYQSAIQCAFDVTGISWQLFSNNAQDLDSILWNANLSWVFHTGTAVIIGPLTQSTGGIADYYFPEDRGNMEKLAETQNGMPSEEMWRILTQGNRVGDTLIFNGKMNYRRHPVSIPSSTTCEVQLNCDTPVVFKGDFRIRIILHGTFKNVIELS